MTNPWPVLLDVNAWLQLADGSASDRELVLRYANATARRHIALTHPVFNEMAGRAPRLGYMAYRHVAEFALRVTAGVCLLPRAKREALELRKGRALLPEEAFRRRGPATRVEWRRSGRTGVPGRQLLEVAPEGAALAVAASVREFVEETAAEDLARLQRTLAHPEVRRVGRRNVLLEDEHAAVARDWALSRVRAVGAQRGLKPRRGLRVEELRTFYVRQLIRVRSIRRIVAEDRSPTKPDRMDLELAVDAACYAGRLVTSDAKLRRSLALWWPKLDVVAFDDWMQQVRGDISRSERE